MGIPYGFLITKLDVMGGGEFACWTLFDREDPQVITYEFLLSHHVSIGIHADVIYVDDEDDNGLDHWKKDDAALETDSSSNSSGSTSFGPSLVVIEGCLKRKRDDEEYSDAVCANAECADAECADAERANAESAIAECVDGGCAVAEAPTSAP